VEEREIDMGSKVKVGTDYMELDHYRMGSLQANHPSCNYVHGEGRDIEMLDLALDHYLAFDKVTDAAEVEDGLYVDVDSVPVVEDPASDPDDVPEGDSN
jgi:hypothetical protein